MPLARVVLWLVPLLFSSATVMGCTTSSPSLKGAQFDDVEAVPFDVSCGLSGRTTGVHMIEISEWRWYSDISDVRLSDDRSYRGTFRVVELKEPSGERLFGSDSAEFVSDDVGPTSDGVVPVMFSPFPPSCE